MNIAFYSAGVFLTSISALRKALAAAVVASISAGELPTVCSHLMNILLLFPLPGATCQLPGGRRLHTEAPQHLLVCDQAGGSGHSPLTHSDA